MKIALIGALALAALAPVAALAAPVAADQAPSFVVRFNDLDLSSQHDAQVLLHRIDDAAMESCGATIHTDPAQYAVIRRSACRTETMASAVAQIHAPLLSAAFDSRHTLAMAD